MKKYKIVLTVVGIIVAIFLLKALGIVSWWGQEAVEVAKEEFAPRAALEKYEWFINQSKYITKSRKDVENQKRKESDIDSSYFKSYGVSQRDWPLTVQVTYNSEKNKARDDLNSYVSLLNGLITEYNGQSEKFNWSYFKNNSDKPPEKFGEYK